jgi:hypothetical protein
MQKWEYLLIEIFLAPDRNAPAENKKATKVQEKMNELGSEGWELVAATESHSPEIFLYFKRPKK